MTQKVDRADPILGFFHRWVEAFARQCESVTVIGQEVGEHAFPPNVSVYSLGKEQGFFRWRQIIRFWNFNLILHRKYDVVLVHMTPVWVVLGAWLWFPLRKRAYLWYEARGGGWALPVALRLVRKVFSATEHGLPRSSPRRVILGHGVDTNFFIPAPQQREEGLVVTVGRITPVKHLEHVVRAFASLPGTPRLFLAGNTITKQDALEKQRILALMRELRLEDRVTIRALRNEEVRDLLQRASLLLHACSGGLDKVVLEAMACGCPIVSSSHAASSVLPAVCQASNETLAAQAQTIFLLDSAARASLAAELRNLAEDGHSLAVLVQRMCQHMALLPDSF
ncbi:MAG: glycosyltransferase family 4 protein [Candidatus Peribacteraceae bacterium]|nr:glycosyltransferase family 4 protein [Candidatus Peribacteraceae bacterium]